MIEAILNMFSDSLSPKSVIMWLRRRISYKNRIAKSKSITYEEFMKSLAELPNVMNDIKEACSEYKPTTLLLIAYPDIDEQKYWKCTGIDKKNKFLFALKLDVSGAKSFNLNEDEIYSIVVD